MSFTFTTRDERIQINSKRSRFDKMVSVVFIIAIVAFVIELIFNQRINTGIIIPILILGGYVRKNKDNSVVIDIEGEVIEEENHIVIVLKDIIQEGKNSMDRIYRIPKSNCKPEFDKDTGKLSIYGNAEISIVNKQNEVWQKYDMENDWIELFIHQDDINKFMQLFSIQQ